MLSRIHAPIQHTPASFRSGSTESVIALPSRLMASSVASVPFSCKSDWNCSVEVTLSPPHSKITSPVFKPQARAGVVPSGSFTTTTPRENSLTPTVCPTGIKLRSPFSTASAAVVHSTSAMTAAAKYRSGPFGCSSCNHHPSLRSPQPFFFHKILFYSRRTLVMFPPVLKAGIRSLCC